MSKNDVISLAVPIAHYTQNDTASFQRTHKVFSSLYYLYVNEVQDANEKDYKEGP
uniref:Group-specific protein n=1 Tax=Heterorhabditis bacteriophora TaxID=37862 RepID=A0A1I7XDW2_HETBA